MIDIGGLPIVSDPTFDGACPHGYLTKTTGPAVDEDGGLRSTSFWSAMKRTRTTSTNEASCSRRAPRWCSPGLWPPDASDHRPSAFSRGSAIFCLARRAAT